MALAASRRIRSWGRTGVGAGTCVLLFAAVALGAGPGGGHGPEALSAAKKESCSGAEATIVGSPGVDRLSGTRGSDVIVAGGGDDVVFGGRGKDIICVNGGADRVLAGAGDDVVSGGSGEDVVDGGTGADRLLGGSGDDRLLGRPGADRISGNNGDDVLGGGPGEDGCLGGRGADSLSGCESGDAPPIASNTAPAAADDAVPANEDALRSVAVLANDSDPDGNRLSVQSIDAAGTRGAVAITNGGDTIGYDPRGKFDDLAAGATATDTFSYRVSDGKGGTDTARVAVTVNGADDRPTAAGDSAAAEEDSQAAIDVLTNDTDVDNGPKSISSASNPAGGTVAITGGGSGLTYTPDPNYCNDPSPAPTDDFTYTLNGGSSATVSVTVTCSPDPPVALNDAGTVAEDANAAAIAVLGNDTDPDGDTPRISSATQPANGAVVLTGPPGSPTGLTYEPAPSYCNTPPPADTFTYTVNDGTGRTDTATVSVTVDCVNDAPINTVPGDQSTGEDMPKTLSAANSNAISINDADAGSNPLEVTLSVANGTLTLADTTGLTFTSGTGAADATMTFTGTQSAINTALDGLTYTPAGNFNGAADLTVQTDDQGASGVGGNLADTDTVTFNVNAVNDAPVNTVPGAQSVDEDTDLTFSAANSKAISVADVDAGADNVEVVLSATNGTLTLSGIAGLMVSGNGTNNVTATGTLANLNAALDGLKYRGNPGYDGPDTLSIDTSDLGHNPAPAQVDNDDEVAITVNPVP